MKPSLELTLLAGALLVAGCDEAPTGSPSAPNPNPTTIDRTTDEPPRAEPPHDPSQAGTEPAPSGARHAAPPEGVTSGSFYRVRLPEGAVRASSESPEVIESVYRLSNDDGVSLTVFQPMPQQTDLDAWTDASERLLDGIPQRHDQIEIGGQPARVGVFPGELRYTIVLDGQGLLFKCFADQPEDEAWMHAHCDETVSSLTFLRANE